MRPGTYRTEDGRLACVERTATGYLVRYADGETAVIGK
jgi:hypothetical protein